MATIPLPPSFDDVYNEYNQLHINQFGVPFNRSFNSDSGAQAFYQSIQGDYNNRLAQYNQQYGTSLTEPPSWTKNWQQFQDRHIAQFGIPMDRPWNSDQGAIDEKGRIDANFQNQLAAYNQQYGTQLQANPDILGPQNQAGAGFLPKAQKSGFLGGSVLGTLAGIGLAPLTGGSSLLYGAIGGAAGGGLQSGSLAGALKGGLIGAVGGGLAGGALGGAADAAWGVNAANSASTATELGTTLANSGNWAALDALAGVPAGATYGAEALTLGANGLTEATASALNSGGSGFDFANYIKTGQMPGGGTPTPPPTIPGAGNGVGLMDAAQQWLKSNGTSSLEKLLSGDAGMKDYLGLLGNLGQAGIGAYASDNMSDAYKDVSQQFLNMGQPYRDRLNATYDPNWSFADTPDMQRSSQAAMDQASRALSAKFGNPADSSTAIGELLKYGIDNNLSKSFDYRNQLGQFGGLGAAPVQAGATAGLLGTKAQGGIYEALGSGYENLTNPFKLNNGFSF